MQLEGSVKLPSIRASPLRERGADGVVPTALVSVPQYRLAVTELTPPGLPTPTRINPHVDAQVAPTVQPCLAMRELPGRTAGGDPVERGIDRRARRQRRLDQRSLLVDRGLPEVLTDRAHCRRGRSGHRCDRKQPNSPTP